MQPPKKSDHTSGKLACPVAKIKWTKKPFQGIRIKEKWSNQVSRKTMKGWESPPAAGVTGFSRQLLACPCQQMPWKTTWPALEKIHAWFGMGTPHTRSVSTVSEGECHMGTDDIAGKPPASRQGNASIPSRTNVCTLLVHEQTDSCIFST